MWEIFNLPTYFFMFIFNLSVWAGLIYGLWKAGEKLSEILHWR